MSRRQALGILTNQTNQIQQQQQQRQTLVTKQVTQKSETLSQYVFSSSSSSSTTTTTSIFKQNDENEIQNVLLGGKSNKQNFDFEIFQDKENSIKNCNSNNDFQIFCENVQQPVQQQQQQQQNKKKQPLQVLETQIFKESPMILDDTIKFQSSKSEETSISYIDIDQNNEEVSDEDDEEIRREHELIERENILLNCEEYAKDIIKNLKELELINKPKTNYIKSQQDITLSMRSILVDWLVEVCEEYKLHTETLYLAVNYTDRFLSKMSVLRGKLQLLGTASIYIASKYEEIFPPDVAEFVYITDDTYTKQQVLRMEHLILKVLNFHMNAPTANCFLLHFIQYTKSSKKIEHLARYLAELTLVEADPFLEYLPSQIATSSLYLSMYILNKEWDLNNMFELTGYNLNDIRSCVYDIYNAMKNASQHQQQAIQEKYKNDRFDCVSLIEPPEFLCL